MQTADAVESPEQSAFRAHCRGWLAEHVPPRPRFRLPQSPIEIETAEQLDYLRTWQRAAYGAGLVGCDYPSAFGGGGLSGCQRVANEEMAAVGAPFLPNIVGLGMAGPAILVHGTEAQKKALLPGLLAGDEIWCQGFSEPEAGSDLANVQTFARRDGERWVVNGHKVWTSLARFASHMILLCRTDRESRYGGLSYFAVPIAGGGAEGITVRPLVKMTGEGGFNEVLFDDFVVDDGCRLDAVGRGWAVAMTTLVHERGAGALVTPKAGAEMGAPTTEASLGEALVGLLHTSRRGGRPAADDPVLRDRVVSLVMRERALALSRRRAGVAALVDHPQRLPLQFKLLQSEIVQAIAQLACEIEGQGSVLHHADPHAPAGGRWPMAYLNSFGFTIAAGSSEIQRNILGERVLGLAKTR